MILGAGIMQVPVIQKAKTLGFNTVVVDMKSDTPGMKYADTPLVCSTMDMEAINRFVKKHPIDGILTTSDAPVKVVSYISEKYGLNSMSQSVADVCTNKYKQRILLKENGFNVPFFQLCDDSSDFTAFTSFPYVVKPVDSSASRGVKQVKNKIELETAVKEAFDYSNSRKIIIESVILGKEFSVETFTQYNETTVVTITEKLIIGKEDGYFVEDTHIEPARISIADWEKIETTVKRAISCIGLNNCPSHTEIIINDSGAYIVEMACRLGGDFITSDLVPLSTGVDMLENLILCALGLPIKREHSISKYSSIQFINNHNKDRVVKLIESKCSLIRRCEVEEEFDSTRPIRSSLDRGGYVILQADTLQELETCLKKIK